MTKSRLFPAQDPKEQLQKAFKTGAFSRDAAAYIQECHLPQEMRSLPEDTSYISLSPDILTFNLDANSELSDLFHHLPPHVKTINFNFKLLDKTQLDKFKELISLVGLAQNVSVINLEWDFNRFPMAELQKCIEQYSMPKQLACFNFTINSPGSENVTKDELAIFKQEKLPAATKLFKDIRFTAIEDHGRHTAYDFARIGR